MAGLRLMIIALGAVAVVAALMPGHEARAAELELYDNFSAPQINPDKWAGLESFNSSLNPNAEAKRFIERGKLHVALTTYGDVTSNSGDRQGRFGLRFSNPGTLTAIEGSVAVKQA